MTQDIPKVVKLARQLYFQRIDELKKAINEDEDQFMAILSEIDDIKSGAMDQKLANDQRHSGAETTKIEAVQHGTYIQHGVEDTVMTLADGDASFTEATKAPGTPGTQSTMEQPTAIRIPKDITQSPRSPVRQNAGETTPIPSINLRGTDTFQQSSTLAIDQSITIPTTAPLEPLQEKHSTGRMEESMLALVKVGNAATNYKDLDNAYDMNVNVNVTEATATIPTTTTTTIASMPTATEEAPSVELSSKRPYEDTHLTMHQQQSPIESSSHKRPRLDHSPTVYRHSTSPFDDQMTGTSDTATLGKSR